MTDQNRPEQDPTQDHPTEPLAGMPLSGTPRPETPGSAAPRPGAQGSADPVGGDRDWFGAEQRTPSAYPPPLPPQQAAEHTQPLGFPPPPIQPAAAPSKQRRGGVGLFLAAIVIGGAAGFGGAAGYDALQDDPATLAPLSGSSSDVQTSRVQTAPDASAAPRGSVEAVADAILPSVVQIQVRGEDASGSGSGIVLSSDGVILTNEHVANAGGADGDLTVLFHDGRTARARLLGSDALTDLAVIKAEGVTGLKPATLDASGDTKVGQQVVAVGSPFGLQATVTSGIVSALNRLVSVGPADSEDESAPNLEDFLERQEDPEAAEPRLLTAYPAIQTDAAINPGNSGGPLLNLAGEVIGINSSIRSNTAFNGEAGSVGLGFAIPIANVVEIIEQLKSGEPATHARLGVTVRDAGFTADGEANTDVVGALVAEVEEGSGGDKAGLRKGDVVTRVDDLVIGTSDDLVALVRGKRPGDKVELTVLRGEREFTTEATLDASSQE